MRSHLKMLYTIALTCCTLIYKAEATNQTSDLSPIFPQDSLPFTIEIQKADFALPNGLHSYAWAPYKDKWLLLAGRTDGLHGFGPSNNFPPEAQNTIAYVIDPRKKTVYSRALNDPSSGLSQRQIDQLSVTSPQFSYKGKTLYICGGYGVDSATGLFGTKDTLTAINIPKFMKWVIKPNTHVPAVNWIRQTSDPILQVTGGYMTTMYGDLSTLLIFGQNFTGSYTTGTSGNYTKQVRRFKIEDDGYRVRIKDKKYLPTDPSFRRRDLNVVPIIQSNQKKAFVALSGVFTSDGGIWTVPVKISVKGETKMADPLNPSTFKQGMNNYVCPTIGMYSKSTNAMYMVLLGGISYGFFQNGVFTTDPEIPFINQVTTIKIDKKGHFTQYLMNNQYPTILSTGSNPGNPLLFGAGAAFFSSEKVSSHGNGVFCFDKIKEPVVIGYIIGGIMSTLPDTNTMSDSTASPYIFKVVVKPTKQ